MLYIKPLSTAYLAHSGVFLGAQVSFLPCYALKPQNLCFRGTVGTLGGFVAVCDTESSEEHTVVRWQSDSQCGYLPEL